MNCKNCSATIEGYLRVCGLCGHMADRGLPTRGVIGVLVVVALALVGLNLNAMQAKDDGSSRNMKSNWLERMAPAERSHAFSGLMKDAGEECAAVSRFYFRGDIGLNAAWNIRCTDTGDWMVLIAANGWTRVAGCAKLNEAGTPCWTRL